MSEWRLTLRPGDDALPAAEAIAAAWNVSVPTACMILLREALGFSPRAAQQDCASGVTVLSKGSAQESGGEILTPISPSPPPHTPPPHPSTPLPPKSCDGGCCWAGSGDGPEHGSCEACCFCLGARPKPKRKRRSRREPDPDDPVDAAFLRTWDAWRSAGGRVGSCSKTVAASHFVAAARDLGACEPVNGTPKGFTALTAGAAELESRALEVLELREPQYLPDLGRWLNPKSSKCGWTDEAMRGERIRAGRQPSGAAPGRAQPTADETAKSLEKWS